MTTPDLTIRQFRSADADAVIGLWQETLLAQQPANASAELLIRKLNMSDDLLFVAEYNNSVVGIVLGGYDGVRGWVYGLAVSPRYQRRGIGRELLGRAESTLRGMGCPKVNLQVRTSNQEVVTFYEQCGYTVEERMSLGKSLTDGRQLPVDPVPTINVTERISLSQITADDKSAYVRYLNETDEFKTHTTTIPFPYFKVDADQWIAKTLHESLSCNHRRAWAIRHYLEMIGGISLFDFVETERAEIGYWLAKPIWGQGIMTQVVRRLCSFAFEQYNLHRIDARVFATNLRSTGVLRNAGFELEGRLRNYRMLNGIPIDDLIFGLLRPGHTLPR